MRLEGFGDRRPRQLSGGQRQRVALARALVNRPKVLLLDEPLGALDLKLREEMQVELKPIQREVGITFVFVTHDQEEALTMSDRIAVFNHGRIEQVGTPRRGLRAPGHAVRGRLRRHLQPARPGAAADALLGRDGTFGPPGEDPLIDGAPSRGADDDGRRRAPVAEVVYAGAGTRYRRRPRRRRPAGRARSRTSRPPSTASQRSRRPRAADLAPASTSSPYPTERCRSGHPVTSPRTEETP